MRKKIGGRWVDLTEEQEAQELARMQAGHLDEGARWLQRPPSHAAAILDGVRAHELAVPTVDEWRGVIGFAAAAIVHLEGIEAHGRRALDALAGAGYTVTERKRGVFLIEVDGHPVATVDLEGALFPAHQRTVV